MQKVPLAYAAAVAIAAVAVAAERGCRLSALVELLGYMLMLLLYGDTTLYKIGW